MAKIDELRERLRRGEAVLKPLDVVDLSKGTFSNGPTVADVEFIKQMRDLMEPLASGSGFFDPEDIEYIHKHSTAGAAEPPPLYTIDVGDVCTSERLESVKEFIARFGPPGAGTGTVSVPSITSVEFSEPKADLPVGAGVLIKHVNPVEITINAKIHHAPSLEEITFAERAFRMLTDED